MKELISIIVPVYRVEPYIRNCIDSICQQTYKNIEIILVDDGSPDACGRICDEYTKKDSRIKVIHKENGGLSSARNAGICAASGDWIGFVDSDDHITEDMYERLWKLAKKYDSQIAIGGRTYVFEDGKQMIRYKEVYEDQVFNGLEALVRMNSFASFDMGACDKLYRKELFEEIRFPLGKLSEDYYVMPRLLTNCERVAYNPRPIYYYNQRKNSLTQSEKINFDFADAAGEQLAFIMEHYPAYEGMARTAYASAQMTVYNFHIKNNVICGRALTKSMRRIVRENEAFVYEEKQLSKIKKLQTFLFVHCLPLYNLLFRGLRKLIRIS